MSTTQKRPMYGWLTAEAISLTGTRLSMIAIPWFVLTTTGSATLTGVIAFAEMAPLVAMKALAGPLVDRVGARRVAIAGDVGSGVVVALIPLLHLLGLLVFPLLVALVAIAGALRGPSDGAKHAMVPAVVEHANVPMERATGLGSAVERTASMVGAAVGGAVIALVGAANALFIDAASFVACAAVLAWATRGMASVTETEAHEEATPYLHRLKEGWDFLRRDGLLLGLSIMVAVTNLVDVAYTSVLVPVWAMETGGGAAVVGALFAIFGGGAIVGAVLASAWAAKLPRYKTYLVAFLVCGPPRFFILALDPSVELVLVWAAIGGIGAGFINPILGAVVYERIPAHLVGRVSSLNTALAWSLMPFGGIVAGLLVGGFGITVGLVVCGVGYLLATMAPALQPSWRAMDDRPAARVPEPVG